MGYYDWKTTPQVFKGTEKQLNILDVIRKGNPDGSHLDRVQICENVDYDVKPGSMEWSLMYLMDHKLIDRGYEKRNGKRTRIFFLTPAGYAIFGDGY